MGIINMTLLYFYYEGGIELPLVIIRYAFCISSQSDTIEGKISR